MSFADSIQSQHKNDDHVIEKDKCWAFDIETLGKLPFVISSTSFTGSKTTKTAIIPSITCACLYNGTIEHSLCFYGVPQTIIDSNLVLLLEILDTAQVLIGFNAIHFDLEYIQRFFKLPITKLNHWISKTVDPYLFMKTKLGITCSLSTILAMNHLPSKSASGLKAIIWAKQGRMDLVLDYCMMDTKLTYTLCFGNNGSFRINDLWLVNWIYNPTHISTFKTTKKFKFQKKKIEKQEEEANNKNQSFITWFTQRQTISLQPSFYLNSYSQKEKQEEEEDSISITQDQRFTNNFISTECLIAQGLITTVLPSNCI
jgi:hypothetical protein